MFWGKQVKLTTKHTITKHWKHKLHTHTPTQMKKKLKLHIISFKKTKYLVGICASFSPFLRGARKEKTTKNLS
jgi:hypothetical protein